MAKKPAAAPAHVEELPPEMDYKAHEATWKAFTNVTKWSIIGLAITLVLLYFIVQP
jgi:hypothetical protein